jgi:DNA topoisomerase-2
MEDCIRNLPNVYDGLKQSQRKILHAFFLKGENTKMKVSQWAGFVSEKTCYHHGEQCLFDTIIKMAQDFVGSNNLPLIQKDGQFGTRLHGGKDAASSRYIFAQLSKMMKHVFRKEDECILNYQVDDGNTIEPVHFFPIIPMLLVNGSVAIATGWSTNIPLFNPKDLIGWIKEYITSGEKSELIPWYNGYKGTIIKREEKKYTSTGILEKKGNTWIIKELPIGIWIDNYKQALEELLENKKIKSLKNYSTTGNVHFEIQLFENYSNIEHDKAIELFSLSSTINLNNMVVLGGDNGIRIEKYNSIDDILTAFSDYRLEMYKKRKISLLNSFQNQIDKLQSKLKFIKSVINDEIVIGKISKSDLLGILSNKNFIKVDDSFDYLVNIPIYDFTLDSIQKLEKNIANLYSERSTLENTNVQDIWFSELDELLKLL